MAWRHAACAAALLVMGPTEPARAQQPCTVEEGQNDIDQGQYKSAVKVFSCVIDAQPSEVEGYRGRAEAQLLLGLYSDAMRDYGRVTARVLPVHPEATATILGGYAARLAMDPRSIPALTGASFARWWLFDYAGATHLLNDLLTVRPDDVYGNLFRGSSRLLRGATNAGVRDLEYGITLAPGSPDVHWVAGDAYTYGLPDPQRAFAEATLALNGGLDTPRVHAILAASFVAFDNRPAATVHIMRHFDLVTTEVASAPAMVAGDSRAVAIAPGRVVEIPIPAVAGETITIATSSHDYFDTVAVLLAPDGTAVTAGDDDKGYFAAFQWPAAQTATYRLRVTFFEALNSGLLLVSRK
ncbi:MAG TPA: tetratricopeptide repeat protein [Vicinamibacterales bacterium]|nr:tetratricopeptide repeat protein [Vicinamibacterales bacterium]